MSDELYEIRNSYYLGNNSQAISDANGIKPNQYRKKEENDALISEKDAIQLKAHIALGQNDLALALLDNHKREPIFDALRLTAEYGKANEVERESIASKAQELWKSNESALSQDLLAQLAVIVASLLVRNGNLESALKIVKTGISVTNTQNLLMELYALNVDILLRNFRPELAEKELKNMQQIDDDATLTQLCSIWVNLAQQKPQEAAQAVDELKEKFGPSPILLNLQALCLMDQGNMEQAEKILMEALGKVSDPETLVNIIACGAQNKKSQEFINRYVTQLKTTHPRHPTVQQWQNLESRFDQAASRVKSQA